MGSLFNKTFFKFLWRFIVIIAVSIGIVVAVSIFSDGDSATAVRGSDANGVDVVSL
jgi:hypothetical protein